MNINSEGISEEKGGFEIEKVEAEKNKKTLNPKIRPGLKRRRSEF